MSEGSQIRPVRASDATSTIFGLEISPPEALKRPPGRAPFMLYQPRICQTGLAVQAGTPMTATEDGPPAPTPEPEGFHG